MQRINNEEILDIIKLNVDKWCEDYELITNQKSDNLRNRLETFMSTIDKVTLLNLSHCRDYWCYGGEVGSERVSLIMQHADEIYIGSNQQINCEIIDCKMLLTLGNGSIKPDEEILWTW